ncbi:MAG: hypothetical protein SFZ02_10930 [bacterium]|nr:hypothetical protein [bacterium]
MAIQWDSLHFYTSLSQDIVARKLIGYLDDMGYTHYDPFNALTGKVYSEGIKTFLSSPRMGWIRLIGSFPLDLSARLSADGLVLHIHITDENADAHVFVDQKPKPFSALQPHLREGYTITDLHNAILRGEGATDKPVSDSIPMNVLPDDVQKMAKGVNPNQIERMMNKMIGQVSKVMGDKSASAKALLAPTQPDWSRGIASNIRVFMDCLKMSGNWNTPDFITLRDAYMAHHRYQRNPTAPRLPSDIEAMNSVPDALLAYLPIYGGK